MVYLIHFEEKLHHAQHYIGFVDKNLKQRINKHRHNKGTKLLVAVNSKGIPWEVVSVWEDGDRQLELRLKNWFGPAIFNKSLISLGQPLLLIAFLHDYVEYCTD